MVLFGGLLLLFLGPALLHSLIGFGANGRFTFGTGSTRLFPLVDVTNKAHYFLPPFFLGGRPFLEP